MNSIHIIGRLTKDPETTITKGGQGLCRMRVAVPRPGDDSDPIYIDVVAWDRLGESCQSYVGQGRQVAVSGRLEHSEWTDAEGRHHSRHEVVAALVDFLAQPKAATSAPPADPAGGVGPREPDPLLLQPGCLAAPPDRARPGLSCPPPGQLTYGGRQPAPTGGWQEPTSHPQEGGSSPQLALALVAQARPVLQEQPVQEQRRSSSGPGGPRARSAQTSLPPGGRERTPQPSLSVATMARPRPEVASGGARSLAGSPPASSATETSTRSWCMAKPSSTLAEAAWMALVTSSETTRASTSRSGEATPQSPAAATAARRALPTLGIDPGRANCKRWHTGSSYPASPPP